MNTSDQKRDLAYSLRKDLNDSGLERYIAENRRRAANEIKMGRNPRRFQFYVQAGILALLMTEGGSK